jgi:hypothetical protein
MERGIIWQHLQEKKCLEQQIEEIQIKAMSEGYS